MGDKIGQVLEISFVLILVYLVVTNFVGFSSATGAIGNLYTGSVKALQGR